MTTSFRTALILAAALITTSYASAQTAATVTLTPERPARWDVSGHVGWLGVNKSDLVDTDWNDWYNAAAGGVTAGYHFTPHLKAEVDVATSNRGHISTYDNLIVPGEIYPFPRQRQHFFRATTVGAGISYQFFENQWFHPSVGVGIDVIRESQRTEQPQQLVFGRDARPPVWLPAVAQDWETSVTARPFAAAGFKLYVSERAFVRSDLRTTWSSHGGESVVFRTGVGFDF
jgi:hypothetical protein